jgi:DNA-binding response OmpR family regulator
MNDERTSFVAGSAAARVAPGTIPIHRILVVDDDASVRQVIAETLIRCGYHVDAAEDGAAAWKTLQLRNYDLLVTDNNMPRVSGVDLVRKLRSARMALPIILVSGMMPTEELNRYPWLQLAATLAKPFTSDELAVAVGDALRATSDRAHIARPPANGPGRPAVGELVL